VSAPAPVVSPTPAAESGAPSVTLVRTQEEPAIDPEDVPLVDEASGVEGKARFAIQCGSFRDVERARELADRIGASTGETARIAPMQMSSGTWHRVLLGDFDSEEAARAKIADVHSANRLLILQVVRLSRPATDDATDSGE
jgi:cell division protein FtsN